MRPALSGANGSKGRVMSLFDTLDVKVKELGGLIVSCQPVPGSPLDKPEIVAAMALAAVKTGAVAVRIEGINNLKATRELISVPIIGIIKRVICRTRRCASRRSRGCGRVGAGRCGYYRL